jgi:hypothetical protein
MRRSQRLSSDLSATPLYESHSIKDVLTHPKNRQPEQYYLFFPDKTQLWRMRRVCDAYLGVKW